MAVLTAIMSALSGDIVARVAAAGLPPLTDGKVLLGRQRVLENSAPPRVVFIPMASKFGPKSASNQSDSSTVSNPNAEQLAQWAQRSIMTDKIIFEVQVWGQASPPDSDLDFDATQNLYDIVIQSVYAMSVGRSTIIDGRWVDQAVSETQVDKSGHVYVFGVEIETPVLDNLLGYLPPLTVMSGTAKIQPADGSPPETAATGL